MGEDRIGCRMRPDRVSGKTVSGVGYGRQGYGTRPDRVGGIAP